ncbi:YTH domain-containing family protein, partial [Tremellales sp. Uapishka_1]
MFQRAGAPQGDEGDAGANISRAHSLRAQAKIGESVLGRSSSLKGVGEVSRRHGPAAHQQSHRASPPSYPSTPHHPFTPPTPPPVSSNAAFPPFQIPVAPVDGADLKRHQSLTQGYGSSNRVRDRLEKSPALLSLEQREDLNRQINEGAGSKPVDEPPTSPIGKSVWSPSQPIDDGWSSRQQLQDAFEAMQLGHRMMGGYDGPPSDRKLSLVTDVLRHPQSLTGGPLGHPMGHPADEPSWVANLVGLPDQRMPQHARSAATTSWQERDATLRQQSQRWPESNQPLGYLQQQQQQLFASQLYGNGQMKQYPYPQPHPGYLAGPLIPVYPTPPTTAQSQRADADVVELARSKGLNPASFDCRPPRARFFVIKSYTEEDVQKSLKHEIWSSTVLGNKRLDTAFREFGGRGPIYLFFSVNGSRHFCGVAQMLTPALRHIRLLNTPERKPITNSRDTQELHYEAGVEVLQIFLDHQTKSKTSLLQDFAYYEGHTWGKTTEPLLNDFGPEEKENPDTRVEGRYDLLLLSDLVFNHSQHAALIATVNSTLSLDIAPPASPSHPYPTPCILVFYTHHRPHLAEADVAFFPLLAESGDGWAYEKVVEEWTGPMFADDRGDERVRGTVWGWRAWRVGPRGSRGEFKRA